MAKCPNCGGRVDVTKDGDWGHCADCTFSAVYTFELTAANADAGKQAIT